MRIAMVSEHASPLAVLGGVDAGGQNVHVAALAAALARRGAEVVVHTRRDDPDLPERVDLAPGRRGAPRRRRARPSPCPRTSCCRTWTPFADVLREAWSADRPDVVHAHFWMSGLAALSAAARARPAGRADLPRAGRGQAPLPGRRRHEPAASASRSSATSSRRADSIIATCTDEAFELVRLGADRDKLAVVPCGVDLALFRPDGPAERRRARAPRRRLLCVGRLVERKGVGNAIAALAALPADVELVVAGGPDRATRWTRTPRPGACAPSPPTTASRTASSCADASRARRCRPLLRSADLVVSRALVRAVRHRAAGGDGVRRARRRLGRRRDDRHGRRRRHRRPRAAARPRARSPASLACLLDDPARRARARRGGRAPRPPPLRLGPRRGRRRTTSTASLRPVRARAGPRPSGASPARRGPTSTSARSARRSTRCGPRPARLERWGARPGRAPAAGRPRCSPPATAAAPRRRSTSRPSWSDGSSPSAARSARSACTATPPR